MESILDAVYEYREEIDMENKNQCPFHSFFSSESSLS